MYVISRGYEQWRWESWLAAGVAGCIQLALAILVVLAAVGWNALPAMAQAGGHAPTVALINNRAIVFNPATRKVYAVDKSRNAVSIFDEGTNSSSSAKVGDGPVAIAINSVTGRIYVANAAAGTVTVLDGNKDVVVGTVNVGKNPYVLAVNERTNEIYVSNTFSDLLTVIDGATNTTTTLKTGSADAIAIDSKANKIYLLGYENSSITVLDGASGTLTKLPVGMHPWGMTLDQVNDVLYATRAGNAELVAWNLRSHAAKSIATGAIPCAVGVNSATHKVYVVNYGDNSVTVIDGATRRAITTLPVGEHPQAIAVDAASNLVYVANTRGNSITVIDGARNTIHGTLKSGDHPYALTIDQAGGKLYAANLGDPAITVIDAASTPESGVSVGRTSDLDRVEGHQAGPH